MKKLLCVLMFGFLFSQDAISTKEITIPIDENTEMIDIGDYIELSSGFYTVQLVYVYLIDTNCDNCEGLTLISAYDSNSNSGIWVYFSLDNGIDGYDGLTTISYENPNLINDSSCWLPDCLYDLEFVVRVSGRFDDTSLNGDMNEDGELDVLDVVSLVQEILDGGMGDVGNLLDVVRG